MDRKQCGQKYMGTMIDIFGDLNLVIRRKELKIV